MRRAPTDDLFLVTSADREAQASSSPSACGAHAASLFCLSLALRGGFDRLRPPLSCDFRSNRCGSYICKAGLIGAGKRLEGSGCAPPPASPARVCEFVKNASDLFCAYSELCACGKL